MENIHAVGNQSLHNGDVGGDGGEQHHEKEHQSDHIPRCAHGTEHLGQRHEHQAGPGAHALSAGEDKYSGNDHHTGEKGGQGVEQFNLCQGNVQIHVLFHIGAVGDHDPHGHAEGEKQLTHGVQENLQKALDSHSPEVRL